MNHTLDPKSFVIDAYIAHKGDRQNLGLPFIDVCEIDGCTLHAGREHRFLYSGTPEPLTLQTFRPYWSDGSWRHTRTARYYQTLEQNGCWFMLYKPGVQTYVSRTSGSQFERGQHLLARWVETINPYSGERNEYVFFVLECEEFGRRWKAGRRRMLSRLHDLYLDELEAGRTRIYVRDTQTSEKE
jgi:hypothetical protein